jgi:hypothetical protein
MKFYLVSSLLIANIQCAPLIWGNLSNLGLFSPKSTSNNIHFDGGTNNINAGPGNNGFSVFMQNLLGGSR